MAADPSERQRKGVVTRTVKERVPFLETTRLPCNISALKQDWL